VNELGNYQLTEFEVVEVVANVEGKPRQFFFVDINEDDEGKRLTFQGKFKVSISPSSLCSRKCGSHLLLLLLLLFPSFHLPGQT